jgi:hypothetical protein
MHRIFTTQGTRILCVHVLHCEGLRCWCFKVTAGLLWRDSSHSSLASTVAVQPMYSRGFLYELSLLTHCLAGLSLRIVPTYPLLSDRDGSSDLTG